MMDISRAIKYVDGEIEKLEQASYMFDSLILPRAQKDKEILEQMREHRLKMMVLKEKLDKTEDVSQDEINQLVPKQFR